MNSDKKRAFSDGHRRAISLSLRKAHEEGRIDLMLGDRNPAKRPEVRTKISASLKKRHLDGLPPFIPKLKTILCSKCGQPFSTAQQNPNQYPRFCPNCRFHSCPVCGKLIKITSKYCGKRYAHNDPQNLKMIEGHKSQGRKIMGENNPARRPEVGTKISEGVRKSYTPELRRFRSERWKSGFGKVGAHCDGLGNMLKSTLELCVAKLLQSKKIEYIYENPLPIGNRIIYPDFTLPNGTIIEVVGYLLDRQSIKQYKYKLREILSKTPHPLVVVTYGKEVPVFHNLTRIRDCDIVALDDNEPTLATIRLENVDIIDYGHVLPFHPAKCSSLHAHSSLAVSVEVTGYVDPLKYMVVDFGDVKKSIKEITSQFDHHLVIGRQYVKSEVEGQVLIEFQTTSGAHSLLLPKTEVYIVEGEATIEVMTRIVAKELLARLPDNTILVSVELSEGIGRSAIVGEGRIFPGYSLKDLPRIVDYHEEKYPTQEGATLWDTASKPKSQ